MAFEYTTPVGRMVYGSVWERRKSTDKKGAPVLIKSGPNAGQQKEMCSFGVAFDKVLANGAPNEAFNIWYRAVIDEARAGYPQFFNGPTDAFTGKPSCTHPRMAFKVSDGDGVDGDGQPNNVKEGWAAKWVVHFSSQQVPRVYDANVGFAPEQQMQDTTKCLPGDYIAVQGNASANIGSETPGVYMNHSLVAYVANGPRIVTGPRASDAFKNIASTVMPAGCVPGATPANVAPAPAVPGAVPTPPAPAVPVAPAAPVVAHDPMAKAQADGWIAHPTSPGYFYKGQEVKLQAEVAALYPAPVAAPVIPAAPAVPPAPPAPPAAPAVPVAPVKQLTPAALAAGFTTYEAAIANHWTDDLLRQNGYLA